MGATVVCWAVDLEACMPSVEGLGWMSAARTGALKRLIPRGAAGPFEMLPVGSTGALGRLPEVPCTTAWINCQAN